MYSRLYIAIWKNILFFVYTSLNIQEEGVISALQNAMLNLQAELERLQALIQAAMDEHANKQKHIDVSSVETKLFICLLSTVTVACPLFIVLLWQRFNFVLSTLHQVLPWDADALLRQVWWAANSYLLNSLYFAELELEIEKTKPDKLDLESSWLGFELVMNLTKIA